MALYGDQWTCRHCGWANFTMRIQCRNCGAKKDDNAPIETHLEMLARIKAENPLPPLPDDPVADNRTE